MYPISFVLPKETGYAPKKSAFCLVRRNLTLADICCVVIPEQDTSLCIADRSLSRLRGSPLPGAGCWGPVTSVGRDKRAYARQRPMHPAKTQWHSQPKSAPAAKAAAAAPIRISAPTRDDGQAPTPNSSGAADPNAPRRPKPPQQRTAGQTHQRKTKGLNTFVRENSLSQRETKDPNNPHPAAASRASGSNCGRRCSITYPA